MQIMRQMAPYLGSLTWAQLVAISNVPVGTQALVTDWGQPFVFRANGEWAPVGGTLVLAQSGSAFSLTGTTDPTDLISLTVPGNIMGATGRIVFESPGSAIASSGNSTINITWGGEVVTGQSSQSNTSLIVSASIRNANALNSQRVNGMWGSTTSNVAQVTTNSQRAQNTANAIPLTLRLTLGGIGASFAFNGYSLTLFK